jgi:phenylpyruvate tautomerase PptA (4-oxalocrotonate tautomerase family)
MPIYEVLSPVGVLNEGVRARLAEAITTIHVEETGAPGEFVNVVFPELPAGSTYTAGKPSSSIIVRGLVRAGRPESVRENILRRMYDACVQLAGADPMSVLVSAIDVPARWVMEAGQILPEPVKEEEDRWFTEVRSRSH